MSKFLDPIANAKVLGFLMILGNGLNLLILIIGFSPQYIISIGYSVLGIIGGLGLRKTKLWGLYFLLGTTVLTIVQVLYSAYQGQPFVQVGLFFAIVNVALVAWFFSAKSRFLK